MNDITIRVLETGAVVTARKAVLLGLTPNEVFADLIAKRLQWVTTFPRDASPAEVTRWYLADLGARILRALVESRPVRFQGRVWESPTPYNRKEVTVIVPEIERAIQDSGEWVEVVRDDDYGILLRTSQQPPRCT